MLRCPPSRISLTADDIADFEHRAAARHYARIAALARTDVRLSPGPQHETKKAIISQEDNTGRKRAVSSASQATICSAEDEAVQELPITFVSNASGTWAVDTPKYCHSSSAQIQPTRAETTKPLDRVIRSPQTPLTKLPDESARPQHSPDQALRLSGAVFNGDLEIRPAASPAHQRGLTDDVPASRRGLPILGEVHHRAYPTSSPSAREPPALSSARARRRNARSHDVDIHQDSVVLQRRIEARHVTKVSSHGDEAPNAGSSPMPELVLPNGQLDTKALAEQSFDPRAPTFVPRTRFGTATGSSSGDGSAVTHIEPQWSSLDSTHSASNLRLRSVAEQNIDPAVRHTAEAGHQQRVNVQPRHRRRSRVSDQNAALSQPTPNLERYPILRPPSRAPASGRTAGSQRPVPIPGRRFSRSPSAGFHHVGGQLSSVTLRTSSGAHHAQLDGGGDLEVSQRTFSGPTSAIAHSVPNLLHPLRSSSLVSGTLSTPSTHRVPSMVSAASGISGGLSSSRQSSAEGLSAATEFLRMRSSPLDELTETFSRMASSRPRSVGHSWARGSPANKQRVSLLSGNLFKQETPVPSPTPTPTEIKPGEITAENQVTPHESTRKDFCPEPESSSPFDIPASLPILPSSPSMPSTPPMANAGIFDPKSPRRQQSPAKSCQSPPNAIHRKPVATPKVKVYDDARPQECQPQTPADVPRTSRRTRGRSDTATQYGLASARKPPVSPPVIPERRSHRHTYPAASPAALHTTAEGAVPATPLPAQSLGHDVTADLRSRSGSNEENELEGHRTDLEQDRRLWLARREEGSLDATPPAEGRFERFMS